MICIVRFNVIFFCCEGCACAVPSPMSIVAGINPVRSKESRQKLGCNFDGTL